MNKEKLFEILMGEIGCSKAMKDIMIEKVSYETLMKSKKIIKK